MESLERHRKVLVTGASGFVGQPVVRALVERGYEVHALARTSMSPKNGVIWHEVDLFDAGAVEGLLAAHRFSKLIHLAWYTGKGCHTSLDNLAWLKASLGLLRAFAENGGECFVGAGTVSEYEYKYGYLTEGITPTHPGTLYGESKTSLFNVGTAFCAKTGITFKWPRIFNLYGPHERKEKLIPSVILSCLRGEDVKVSDCKRYQDYLFVQDVATGIVDVMESDSDGPVNICSGEPLYLRDLVMAICKMTEYKGDVLWGSIPSAFDEALVVGNNARLLKTGWQQRYTLEQGLRATIEWWRESLRGER